MIVINWIGMPFSLASRRYVKVGGGGGEDWVICNGGGAMREALLG